MKLHLGCGNVYKPGYINIDKSKDSVADKIMDVSDLPFESKSVELIEAFQLLEHFDYIHCKYILSEWFRVLKPGGLLVIETPDLKQSFKKLISSDTEKQKKTLQWIYGIDSPGLQHKTGFTYKSLKQLLEETGFEKISQKKQETHKYEPGMRVECRKPNDCADEQFIANFRKRLRKSISDDSYILLPLEDWLKKLDKKDVDGSISRTAICNPEIPLAFVGECAASGSLKKADCRERIQVLEYLVKMKFHKRLLPLWKKSKKSGAGEFENFVKRIEMMLSEILSNPKEYKERLDYITTLKPADIELFDPHMISLEAERMFSSGVKQFHKGKFMDALGAFLDSSRMNPDSPLTYWNIARLSILMKSQEHEAIGNYEKAVQLTRDRKKRKEIEKEMQDLKSVPREPIAV